MTEAEYLKEEQEKAKDLKERITFLKRLKGLKVYFYERRRRPNENLYNTERFILEIYENYTWDDLEKAVESFEKSNIVTLTQVKDIVDKTQQE